MRTTYKIFIAKIIHFFLVKLFKFKSDQSVIRGKIKWKLNLNEGIDLSIFLFGNFQRDITNVIFNITKKFKQNFIILDIGSNIGDKSLNLSEKFIKNKSNFFIHSIEATDYALKKQIKNLSLNEELAKNIKLHNAYITNEKKSPGEIYSSWDLTKKKTHKIHRGVLMKITKKTKNISLDDFIKNNKIHNIKIIKIDVDGHELNVLKSGIKFLIKHSPIIIMEYASYAFQEHGYNVKDFYSFLNKVGYKVYDFNLNKIKKIEVGDGSSVDIILSKRNLNINNINEKYL